MQPQHVPLNPFRTPKLHRNTGTANTNNSSCNSKDSTINEILMVVNSWIENPILRIIYILGITVLLISLLLVGYEAYQQFSNHVSQSVGPHQLSRITATIESTVVGTDQQPVIKAPIISPNGNDNEVLPENIVLPEILFQTPPTGSIVVANGRQPGIRGSASSSSETVSPPQEQRKKDVEPSNHPNDDAIADDDAEGDSKRTSRDGVKNKVTTDDNVEQILRPKEVHSKLLGIATRDYLQSAQKEESNYHGFGGEDVVTSPGETKQSSTAEDSEPDDNRDGTVVVLLPRKGDSSIVAETPNRHDTIHEDHPQLPSHPTTNDQAPPLSSDDTLSTTTTIERHRRLRHDVVAIPSSVV